MRWNGWRADLLWALVSTVLALGGLLVGPPGKGADAILAIASGAAMGLVRRQPLIVVAVQALLFAVTGAVAPSLSAVIAILLLWSLGILAYTGSWQAMVAGAAITYLALVWTLVPVSNPPPFDDMPPVTPDPFVQLVQLVSLAGVTAMPVAFGRYLSGVRRARKVAEERAAETALRQSFETRAARLAERSRLARDLHDIVAHHVGAMTLRASAGKLALDTGGDVAHAHEALSDVAATGRHVLDELRALLVVLRDPDAVDTVDAEALVTDPEATILDAADRVRGAGVPVKVSLDKRLAGASLLVRATTARVAQEALTNVLKHAGPGTPTALQVTVTKTGAVRLAVYNALPPGQATKPVVLPGSGLGLAGMRERVALLGGVLVAAPVREDGWAVKMELPAKGAG